MRLTKGEARELKARKQRKMRVVGKSVQLHQQLAGRRAQAIVARQGKQKGGGA